MPDHIASMVVHIRPESEAEVCATLCAMPGLEIHANEGGKLVITLETASEAEIAGAMTAMNLLDGVYCANLVFHYHEPPLQGAAP